MCGGINSRGKKRDQRRYRTAVRAALRRGDDDLLPDVKTYLDPRGLPSDGWVYFGRLDPDTVVKLLRK
jgi:hypothetical protein